MLGSSMLHRLSSIQQTEGVTNVFTSEAIAAMVKGFLLTSMNIPIRRLSHFVIETIN